MEIIGHPSIELSDDCIDFGNVMAFTSKEDSVYIFNQGCNSLMISGLSNSIPEFTSFIESNTIPPNHFGILYVNFSPNSVSTFNDTLIIENSDTTMQVCLYFAELLTTVVLLIQDYFI